MKAVEIGGKRFGGWTAIHFAERRGARHYWLCRCKCGVVKVIRKDNLTSGHTKSCGCDQGNEYHGKSGYAIYGVWRSMVSRCHNKSHVDYKNYGGRGISVCVRWRRSFENFYTDTSPRPSGMSLDRIDNNGDYTAENCRWATRKQQNRNTRRNRVLTFNGESKCVSEWSEITGIRYHTIIGRIDRCGWSIDKALTTKTRGE